MTQEVEQTQTQLVLEAVFPQKLAFDSVSVVRVAVNYTSDSFDVETHRFVVPFDEVFASSELRLYSSQFGIGDSVIEASDDAISLTDGNVEVFSEIAVDSCRVYLAN